MRSVSHAKTIWLDTEKLIPVFISRALFAHRYFHTRRILIDTIKISMVRNYIILISILNNIYLLFFPKVSSTFQLIWDRCPRHTSSISQHEQAWFSLRLVLTYQLNRLHRKLSFLMFQLLVRTWYLKTKCVWPLWMNMKIQVSFILLELIRI